MIVVADTSPVNYLILLDQAELLHQLYGEVVLPRAVHAELTAMPDGDSHQVLLSNLWLHLADHRPTKLGDCPPSHEEVNATLVETVSANLDPGEREANAWLGLSQPNI